jgi:hypothetical protein
MIEDLREAATQPFLIVGSEQDGRPLIQPKRQQPCWSAFEAHSTHLCFSEGFETSLYLLL